MITGRSLVRYALPMVLSSLGGVVVGLTDTLIIGHFSTEALAGVGLGASLYELPINALLGGLLAYRIISPRVAGRNRDARDIAGLVLTLRGLLPWTLGSLLLVVTVAIWMQMMGASAADATVEASGDYLLGRAPSLLAEPTSTALVVTLVGWGRARTPLMAFLVTSGTNLLLDYCLVYGPGPFPRLGALGDGVASSIGAYAAIPCLLWLVRRQTRMSKAVTSNEIVAAEFSGWKRLTAPAVGSALVDYGGNLVFTVLIGLGSTTGLAAARIATNMHLLAFLMVSSLSSAALYLVGRERIEPSQLLVGPTSLRRRFVGIGCVAGFAIAVLAWPVAMLTSPDPPVRSAAATLVGTVALMMPIMTWAYANVTVLRVAQRTGSDFLSNALSVWVAQIPVAVVGLVTIGPSGAFAGLAAYWVCRALATQRQVRAIANQTEVQVESATR